MNELKKYTEIKFYGGITIDSAVKELILSEINGSPAFGYFNGEVLYSNTVSLDSAYLKITGKTRYEFIKQQENSLNEYKKEQQEYEKNIPNLINEYKKLGHDILSVDKWDKWDEIVPIRLRDLYKGMELDNCLEIAVILKQQGNEGFTRSKEILNGQGHSEMSYGLVLSMIETFADYGEQFVEWIKASPY